MDKTDYLDPSCPFDVSDYQSVPQIRAVDQKVDVLKILEKVDSYYASLRYRDAERLLEESLELSREYGDKAGELGILSELIGVYRKSGEKKKGIDAIYSAFKLIEDLGLEGTATAGTVWVNGGTTLRAFNMSTDALPYFYMASRAYSANIPADDYRFAGLYNNLGSCLEALNKNEEALKYYELALAVVKQNPLTEIDAAITWINMAEVYDKMEPRDEEKIEECVNNCMAIFNNPKIERDEYYSFHAKGCAGGLKSLGYFRDARELKKRAEDIDHALS